MKYLDIVREYFNHKTAVRGVLAFAAIIILTEFLFVRFMPMAHWVNYTAIEPIKSDLACGEKVYFAATRKINRPVFASWSDVIYCYKPDGSTVYEQGFQSAGHLAPSDNLTSRWVYDEPMPCQKTCYLESTTTLHLAYGVMRSKTILSGPFIIN